MVLKVDLLRASFYELKRRAAPGWDGVTWHEYEQKLEDRLPELERELHIGSYRATPAKRGYITKDDVIIVRYVDDAVFGFQYEAEGRAFLEALRERLAAYGLTLHPTKTRLVEFGRFAACNRRERGQGKPETFDFLGFTHICGVKRQGRFYIRRITIGKRLRRKLKEVKAKLIKRMHRPLEETGAWLASVIRGFTNFHAIPGNMKAPRAFYTQISRLWLWVIRRRSQKARSRWTWERFYRLQQHWLPRPRVVHPYPSIRFDAKYSR